MLSICGLLAASIGVIQAGEIQIYLWLINDGPHTISGSAAAAATGLASIINELRTGARCVYAMRELVRSRWELCEIYYACPGRAEQSVKLPGTRSPSVAPQHIFLPSIIIMLSLSLSLSLSVSISVSICALSQCEDQESPRCLRLPKSAYNF